MKRLEANLQILKLLEQYIQENPDLRFGQALYNLAIIKDVEPMNFSYIDRIIIHEEPTVTLERLNSLK